MSCDHEYEPTGYVQTTFLDVDDKQEKCEWKCLNCLKKIWLPLGIHPNIKRASSLKANVSRGQLKIRL